MVWSISNTASFGQRLLGHGWWVTKFSVTSFSSHHIRPSSLHHGKSGALWANKMGTHWFPLKETGQFLENALVKYGSDAGEQASEASAAPCAVCGPGGGGGRLVLVKSSFLFLRQISTLREEKRRERIAGFVLTPTIALAIQQAREEIAMSAWRHPALSSNETVYSTWKLHSTVRQPFKMV